MVYCRYLVCPTIFSDVPHAMTFRPMAAQSRDPIASTYTPNSPMNPNTTPTLIQKLQTGPP